MVTLGIWPALLGAATLTVPQPDLVHDRFHVLKHLNEGGDTIRKQEQAELSDSAWDWPTGRQYLLLKYPVD